MTAFWIVGLVACYAFFRSETSRPKAIIGTALSALALVGWAYLSTRVIG